MGPLYRRRREARVAVGASGVAVRRMRREGRGHRARGRQDSLAMPILGGARALPARKTWQCQSRVARAPSTPRNIGSARAEWLLPEKPGSASVQWRMGAPRQKSLAVPMLSGATSRKLALLAAPIIGSPPAPSSQRCSSRRTSSLRLTSNSRARSSRWAT